MIASQSQKAFTYPHYNSVLSYGFIMARNALTNVLTLLFTMELLIGLEPTICTLSQDSCRIFRPTLIITYLILKVKRFL